MKNRNIYWLLIPFAVFIIISLTIYLIDQSLQNEYGPTRKIIYIPETELHKSMWVIIDTINPQVKEITACFHGLGRLEFNDKKTDNKNIAFFKSNNKKIAVIPVTKGELISEKGYNSHLNRHKKFLKINTRQNKIITLIIKKDSSALFFDRQSDKTTVIKDKLKLEFRKDTNCLHNKYSCGLLLRYMVKDKIIGELYVDALSEDGKKSTFFINSSNKIYKEKNIRYTNNRIKKADGLNSSFENTLGYYYDGKNYNWKISEGARQRILNKEYTSVLSTQNVNNIFSQTVYFDEMINEYRKISNKIQTYKGIKNNWKRACMTAYAALISRIDNNKHLRKKVVTSLCDLENIYGYYELLNRSRTVFWFSIAYDILLPTLAENEKKKIEKQLINHAEPLNDFYSAIPINNWRIITGTALIQSGLLLGKPEWIEKSVNHLDRYFDFGIKEGVCYEGNSYLSFGFSYMPYALQSLAKNKIINFASDERFQKLLASLIYQISPDGQYPCFEDCQDTKILNHIISACSRLLDTNNAGTHKLAKMCKWVEENHIKRKSYCWLPDAPLYVDDHLNKALAPRGLFLRKWINGYSDNSGCSIIIPGGGLTVFRDGWEEKDDLLVLTAKNYKQTHIHMDELSFELWIDGEKMLTNSGYPGFGEKYHKWTTKSEASNTVLVNGQGQINESGATFKKYLFTPELKYVEIDGSELYKHPGRNILPSLKVLYFIVFLCLIIIISYSWYDYNNPVNTEVKLTGSNIKKKPSSWIWLTNSLMTKLPLLIKKMFLEEISKVFTDRDWKTRIKKYRIIYSTTQGFVFGIICFVILLIFVNTMKPYVNFYKTQDIYPWINMVHNYYWLLPYFGVPLGYLLFQFNLGLLDMSFFKSGSNSNLPRGFFREILRISYADLTPMFILLLLSLVTINKKIYNLLQGFIIGNLDPWSIQIHLCTWLSNALVFSIFFLVFKTLIQAFAAKKCGIIMAHLTDDIRWKKNGFRIAFSAILLKKMIWIMFSLITFLILITLINGYIDPYSLK